MPPRTFFDRLARRSIASKALLLGIVPTVGALLLMTLASFGSTYILARASLREQLDVQSRVLTQALSAAMAFGDRQVASETIRAQRAHPRIDAICVYDAGGQLFVSDTASFTTCPATQPLASAIAFPEVARAIVLGGHTNGTVVLTGNVGNLFEWIESQSTITLVALLTGFLLAVLLARRLRRAVIGPLIELATAADEIARGGDYSVRATATATDEVGQLAQSFNTMLDAVDRTDRERARVLGELEQRNVQLSRLASDLTLADQSAREQLGTMLHDGLQQLLFSARLKLDRVAGRLSDADDQRRLVESAGHDLHEAIATARSLSMELFPPALHEPRLAAGLAWLADWMEQRYGLHVDLSVDEGAVIERKEVRALVFESVREVLFNVVKHAHVDRVAAAVTPAADGRLRITIRDEGRGFDAAGLAGDAGGPQGGLGLFRIGERLALLGGSLEIRSAPGAGTVVVVVAPGDGQGRTWPSAAPAARVAPPVSTRRAAGASPLRVLIVDDHAPVREDLQALLAGSPDLQLVGEASDGAEAIAQAAALHPDAILMDISMPRMGGVEATRRIRDQRPDVLIFGLSMEAKGPGIHPIEAAGANGYFEKSAGMETVIAHLRALQERSLDA